MKLMSRLALVFVAFFLQPGLADSLELHIGGQAFDPVQGISTFKTSVKSSNEFIVQFDQAITEKLKSSLEQKGLQILGYIPSNGLILKGENVASIAKAQAGFRAIVPMNPTWKLSESLKSVSVFNAKAGQKVLVRSYPGQAPQFPDEAIVFESKGKMHLVQLTRSQIVALAADPSVEFIEPVPEVTTFEMKISGVQSDLPKSSTGYESGLRISGFESAWERGFSGDGEKVAVADTGLDMGKVGSLHQDFANVTKGYAFGLFAKDWKDPQGHGTHVAGSVGGSGAASNGELRGGAFSAEIIPQGMWSPVLKNLSVPSRLSDMFEPAYNDGARVHTNSWGSPRDLGAYTGMSAQVDEYMWNNPEFLILFAAGNSGVDADRDGRIDEGSVSSPGTAKNALTVGASENYLLEGGIQRKLGELAGGEPWGTEPLASDTLSNNENGMACFSSRGPTRDGRLKPEIVAPGTNIVSVCSRVDGATKLWGNYNDDYCYAGGTSMSTPITAGGAAVTRNFIKETYNVASPSAALVKALMMHTAYNMYPGQYGDRGKSTGQELLMDGPNMHQGFGRLDMDNLTSGDSVYRVIDHTAGVATDETATFEITGVLGKDIRVTLVYTDAPAAASASRTLVNDLALGIMTNETGDVINNSVNNHETLAVSSVDADTVTVQVTGINVPMGKNGKQPFALVIGE